MWAGVSFWQGLYVEGGLAVLFFFVSGGLILRSDPVRYMFGAAQGGNDTATIQLQLIQQVTKKRDDYLNQLGKDGPNDKKIDPELQYYEAIEKHIETVGHKEPVLIVQGTDREFCEASFELYKAGYEHDTDYKFIACATAQAAHDYEKDPELAVLFLKSFRDGVVEK